jgi:hypothetical protein
VARVPPDHSRERLGCRHALSEKIMLMVRLPSQLKFKVNRAKLGSRAPLVNDLN